MPGTLAIVAMGLGLNAWFLVFGLSPDPAQSPLAGSPWLAAAAGGAAVGVSRLRKASGLATALLGVVAASGQLRWLGRLLAS